ncbi:MAG: hypothetical protein ACTSPB_15350 [Candidatus Thorarchaeota archaeon]
MKVKIQNRSVYHKFAEVEIEIPKDWNDKDGVKDYYNGYLLDYLHDHSDLYDDKMDEAMSKAEYVHGNGSYDYRGMDDTLSTSEWRFECDEEGEGGHL